MGGPSGWGLCGGRQGGKSPSLRQIPLQGLQGWVMSLLPTQKVPGTLHAEGSFSPRPQAFAVATGPFGQAILLWIDARNDPSVPDG